MYLYISKVNGDGQQIGKKGRVGLERASGEV